MENVGHLSAQIGAKQSAVAIKTTEPVAQIQAPRMPVAANGTRPSRLAPPRRESVRMHN